MKKIYLLFILVVVNAFFSFGTESFNQNNDSLIHDSGRRVLLSDQNKLKSVYKESTASISSDCDISLTTTFVSNNSHTGNMFDVIAKEDIVINSFSINSGATADYAVYYKTGTHVGFHDIPDSWSLIATANNVVSNGYNVPTPLPINLELNVAAGERIAFYIICTNVRGEFYYTNGTGVGNVYAEDDYLQIIEGYGCTEFLFDSNFFSPRVWNGSICYNKKTNIEPVCNPIDINLDADGKYKLDSLDMIELTSVTPDSLTTFDDMKIFAYPDTFTTANIEWPVFVRVTAYDKNYIKSRCWAMVTVHDSMPPTVVGNDVEIFLDSAGMAVVTKEQLTDSATFDVSGIVSTSIDKDTFTCANVGENWVILSATDIYGNVGTDSVLVTVNSGMPALDSIPDVNITVVAGVCETTIEYPLPVIKEICGISVTQTAGLGRDGLFPVGTTTETWMVINCKGDTTEVSFDVTVTAPNAFPALDEIADVTADEDAPEISVPVSGITYGNDCLAQTITVVAETDNTELVDSVAVVYTDGDITGLVKLTLIPDMSGTAKITVSVTDSEGATMFRSFNLVVNEVADTIVNKEGFLATAVWTKEIEAGINMYPNPTQDMVTIDIRNYSASQTEVAVFNMTGSEVIRKTYPAGETIRFSMNEQVSGVYLVKMDIDGNHIIKKLVVDKK